MPSPRSESVSAQVRWINPDALRYLAIWWHDGERTSQHAKRLKDRREGEIRRAAMEEAATVLLMERAWRETGTPVTEPSRETVRQALATARGLDAPKAEAPPPPPPPRCGDRLVEEDLLAADGLRALTGGAGTYAVLGSLFVITALLGLFISNTATAVLMAPVALALADDLQASPYPFAMIVALAASTAFMTPISSPVNMLVLAPGNYTFGDFMRIGVPFAVIVMVVSVILVPWLLPLY